MESREKLKVALSITLASCLTLAISIYFTKQFRKHRKQKRPKPICYLTTETKPQDNFKRVLADNYYSQFKHLKLNNNQDSTITGDYVNANPYKEEIAALVKYPNVEVFNFFEGKFEELEMREEYVWVESEVQLRELAEALSKETVIAVDTEQHSFRSFLGFTALIQISTKAEDYLVDTIALHDVMGILRPVFANPKICKVFHGADNDILWLQRDFHIYVVNLFDTAKACDILSKPQRSLAYLLEEYCGVAKNKLLQREDWRQRPLPEEMVQYARMDAHYLLYIAQCLSSELEQHDCENSSRLDDKLHFLLEASRRSNVMCLQLFSKEIEAYPGESAASSLISRYLNDQGSFSSSDCESNFQELVRLLCAWRDIMARLHDESLRFVLSEQAIVALASRVPATEIETYNTISEADLKADSMNLNFFFQSPSPVVCSHLKDFKFLLQKNAGHHDDVLQLILEHHLSSKGSCPLSLYNYGLLSKSSLKLTNKSISKQIAPKTGKQGSKKASRQLFVQKFSCKSPVYHNYKIYANDGRLLCYCDRKKLEWYLDRNLAKLVEDDPPAIMLLFEPKGRPEDEGNDFYVQSKKNICVGCGEGNHYLRYRIIPSCYRMHFPEHLKSHRSHDIVLLCVDCHEIAHAAAEKHKRQIADEFGIPLYVRNVVDSNQSQKASESTASLMTVQEPGVSPLQLRTAAMALLRHGPTMPSKRREELTQIVMKYYGGREISEEDLEQALLVGMTPHERRRFEKKRGLRLKHSKSYGENEVPSLDNGQETVKTREDYNISMVKDININSPPSSSGDAAKIEGVNNEIDNDGVNLEKSDASEISVDVYPGAISENGNLSNESRSARSPVYDGNTSTKHELKYSLLGHGPHGKQVVDHLLKEHGEDGIRQFCQRWRQVFVDALHPRFLPAGWDVRHRGKRDFGEFSVYKPTNKGFAASGPTDHERND